MPGWHDTSKPFADRGQVKVAGIIQEQHPDRARLFMQWKQMDWPLMVDSLNLLEVTAVPITLFVDESGIIRAVNPRKGQLKTFLEEPPAKGSSLENPDVEPPDFDDLEANLDPSNALGLSRFANALFLWKPDAALGRAIELYEDALRIRPDAGLVRFRLGVAHRRRYDSAHRVATDFTKAIEQWGLALEIDPNQYIWRRRIQQYGPRLEKPYPFYDWVPAARETVVARGEKPVSLIVEPTGAEYASPLKEFAASTGVNRNPDPAGRIHRDWEGFIRLESTVVPTSVDAGDSGRVHLAFTPNQAIKAHWNNEVDGLNVWIEPAPGWEVDLKRLQLPNPPLEVNDEPRQLEFEIRVPKDAKAGIARVKGFALYYVCEDVNGTCLYRRQDFSVPVQIVP